MQIRIRAGQKHADPCGSGSETLIDGHVDTRAGHIFFPQEIIDAFLSCCSPCLPVLGHQVFLQYCPKNIRPGENILIKALEKYLPTMSYLWYHVEN